MLSRHLVSLLALAAMLPAAPLPVRGLHLSSPKPSDVPRMTKFIREVLPKEGVNTLVLEINYHYQFKSHPEVADADALSLDDARAIATAARESNVKLIPLVNLLGHQSWAKTTFGLLRAHPEFDETVGLYPDNKDIYCRSYCPTHPQVHAIVFDLIDEILDAFQADTFHAGMDEVFIIGDDACPRCKGQNKAKLFAGEVRAIHDHLAEKGRHMWFWADRLIDGETTGIGEWEASKNGTAPAILDIPHDVVLCDWHYEAAHATTLAFALSGFEAVSASWRKPAVALRQMDLIRLARSEASPQVAARLSGMLHTTWMSFEQFSAAYWHDGPTNASAQESVLCFREIMQRLRQE
jgi:hypothetical protein